MPLTEDEEFELLSLEREKAMVGGIATRSRPDSINKNIQSGQNPVEAGLNYTRKHPFKTVLQSARETTTGEPLKDLQDRTAPDYSNRFGDPSKHSPIVNEMTKAGITMDEFGRRMGLEVIDAVQVPGNYIGAPIAKGLATGAKAIEKAIPEGLKKSSYGLMQSIVGQLPKEFRYGANGGRAAVKEKIKGNVEEIATQSRSKIDEINPEGDALVQAVNKIDNYSPAVKVIDDKISELRKNAPRENSSTIARLENAKKDLLGVVEDTKGNITDAGIDLSKMTTKEALDFKRKYDYVTQWKGIASDDAVVNSTLQKSRAVIKEQLNKNVPGLKEWNQRYADLSILEQSAKRRAIYDQAGSGIRNMFDRAIRSSVGITTVGAAMTGHLDIAAEILVGIGAKEVINNPMVKSNLAQFLYKLSNADKAKIFKAVPWVRNQFRNIMSSVNKETGEPVKYYTPPRKPDALPAPEPAYLRERRDIPKMDTPTGSAESSNPIPMKGYVPPNLPSPQPKYLQERALMPRQELGVKGNPQYNPSTKEPIPIHGATERATTSSLEKNVEPKDFKTVKRPESEYSKSSTFNLRGGSEEDFIRGLQQKVYSAKNMTEFVNSQKPKSMEQRKYLINFYREHKR